MMGSVKKKARDSGMQRVSGKELREYLKLPIDEELSEGPGEEVRILPDGRVLWRLGGLRGGGTTWPSREAFTEYRRRGDEEAAKQVAAGNPSQIGDRPARRDHTGRQGFFQILIDKGYEAH